jgi:serine/threonine protein kinase
LALTPPISRTPTGYVLAEKVESGLYGTRWLASKPSDQGSVVDLVALDDDDFLVALCTNAMCIKGAAASQYTVSVLDAGWLDNGDYYQVLDLPGSAVSLSKTRIPMLEGEALMAGLDLIRALKHLHKREYLHACICPEAVYVLDGRFRLGEFWWAHTLSGKTLDGELFEHFPRRVPPEALSFFAPEVLLGFPPSRESDLYSVGALMFYLLTGETPRAIPFDEHALFDLEKMAKKDVRSISDFRSFSALTVAVLEKMLDPDADKRSNIFRFEDMLAHAIGEETSDQVFKESD